MLPVCVWGIVVVLAITARDLKVLYPTPARRLAVAAAGGENAALRFLFGRLNGTSVGAFVAARWGVWAAAFAALLTIFIVVRHTRADEEAGRLELVGSAAGGTAGAAHRGAAGGRDRQRGDSPADLPVATRAQAAASGLGRARAVHRRVRAGVRRRGRRRRPAGDDRAGRPRHRDRRARRRLRAARGGRYRSCRPVVAVLGVAAGLGGAPPARSVQPASAGGCWLSRWRRPRSWWR